jgi:hypothetical protein
VNRQDEQALTALRNEAQHVANGGLARPSVLIAAADTLAARVRDLEAALRPAADRTCVYSTTHGGCSCYSCVARAALAPAEER